MTTHLDQDGKAVTPRSIAADVDSGDLGIPEAAALIEQFIAHETEALRADHARLVAIINTPQSGDFLRAVSIEAEHQLRRHGAHDAGKTPADWYWLIGHLAGKALHAITAGDRAKFEHHLITTAGALKNWHHWMVAGATKRSDYNAFDSLQETTTS